MQMTEAFASAVTVSVPIFLLAAGAEARGIRERLRRPDERWERDFAAYKSEHELDLSGHPSDIFAYLKGVPGLSKLYVVERIIAIGSALIWLAVFVLLGIAELRCLVWLADADPPGNSGLAAFSVIVIAVAMAALIVAPDHENESCDASSGGTSRMASPSSPIARPNRRGHQAFAPPRERVGWRRGRDAGGRRGGGSAGRRRDGARGAGFRPGRPRRAGPRR